MSTLSKIPLDWDINWFMDQMRAAGVINNYGYAKVSDGYEVRYRAESFDIVQWLVDEYPTRYADEVLRPHLIAKVTELRWVKQQVATFMGMPLLADDVTVGRITAAAFLMDADPASPQSRRWKVGPDVWVDVDRPMLVGMGTAIANHMQSCFDREEALHLALLGAEDVEALNAIDIEAGWPE